MATARKVFTFMALTAALASSAPLFMSDARAADICCETSDDCPTSYGCLVGGDPCGPGMSGRCIVISGGGRTAR